MENDVEARVEEEDACKGGGGENVEEARSRRTVCGKSKRERRIIGWKGRIRGRIPRGGGNRKLEGKESVKEEFWRMRRRRDGGEA